MTDVSAVDYFVTITPPCVHRIAQYMRILFYKKTDGTQKCRSG